MATKKRIRVVDARGKVKDSPDIRMTLDTSENPSFNGLGSRFKFKSTQKRKSEYGNYFHLEAVYSLDGGSYEVMIVEDASDVLDYAGIKPRDEESFFDEESETYEYGEFVDYNDYLKSLLPDTLADVKDLSMLARRAILDLWL